MGTINVSRADRSQPDLEALEPRAVVMGKATAYDSRNLIDGEPLSGG
jgi:hypothetical protein